MSNLEEKIKDLIVLYKTSELGDPDSFVAQIKQAFMDEGWVKMTNTQPRTRYHYYDTSESDLWPDTSPNAKPGVTKL